MEVSRYRHRNTIRGLSDHHPAFCVEVFPAIASAVLSFLFAVVELNVFFGQQVDGHEVFFGYFLFQYQVVA